MLNEILVILVSVAIATRIALDWLRDVKKAADADTIDDERPEG